MPNIILQDLTAMIHHTSRFNGNQFDMVHVETILQTDVPLTPEMQWYVPSGTSIPDEILPLMRASNVSMYPMSAEYINNEVSNMVQASQQRDLREVEHDASLLLLQAIMVQQSFTPVSGTTNLYHLAYDYKLFPTKENPNAYDFIVVLPFHGLGIPNGSRVQMTIILPIAAQIDTAATQGIAVGGVVIEELVKPMENVNRNIISFEYHQDPDFTVRYMY